MADSLTPPTQTYQLEQTSISAAAIRDTVKLWPIWDVDDLDGTWPRLETGLLAMVERYHRLSGVRAGAYYRNLRRLRGVPGEPAIVVPDFDREQALANLRLLGPIFTKKALSINQPNAMDTALTRVVSAVVRLVLNGGRETVSLSASVDPQILGVSRVTAGTCDFCSMLATRGAVKGEEFKAHSNCRCIAEPVWDLGEDSAATGTSVDDLIQGVRDPQGIHARLARGLLPEGKIWEGAELWADGRIKLSNGTILVRKSGPMGEFLPLTNEMVEAIDRLPEYMQTQKSAMGISFVDAGGLRRFDGSIDLVSAGGTDITGVQINMSAGFRKSMYDTLIHEMGHAMDSTGKVGWFDPTTQAGSRAAYGAKVAEVKGLIRGIIEDNMDSLSIDTQGHFAYPQMEMWEGRIGSAVNEFWAEAVRFYNTDPGILDGVPGLRQAMTELEELWKQGPS